jgi:sulfate transporter 4
MLCRLGEEEDSANNDDPLSSLLISAATTTEEHHGTMIRKRAGHVSGSTGGDDNDTTDRTPLDDASEGHHDQRIAASSSFLCNALNLKTAMAIYMREPMSDLLSGVVVGLLIVPQSMSYAKLAGLPVEYGLYSSLLPLYTYALSYAIRDPHSILAIGPVALVSLLLASGLHSVMSRRGVPPNSNEYTALYAQLATQTSLLVGVLYILLGSLRVRRGGGAVANALLSWLSPTVISGFSSGAAVLIAASQCKYFMGYAIPPSDTLPAIVMALMRGIHQFQVSTFVVGITALVLLVLSKKPSICGESTRIAVLMPLFLTIGAVLGTHFALLPVLPIVGPIPSGWPASTLPNVTLLHNVRDLFPLALGIVVIGFMETMAIAQQLAAQSPLLSSTGRRRTVDASQELWALGLANLCGGLAQAYPVAGSFSRSAIQRASGAQTRAAGAVAATVVAVALRYGTRFFEQLPYCVLAAIVVASVLSLLDIPEAKRLWTAYPSDFCIWCLAFAGTLLWGCEYGLLLGLSCSWLLLLYQVTHVPVTWLGQMPDAIHEYRDRQVHPAALPIPGMVMIRWNGPINFLNIRMFERTILVSVSSDSLADEEEAAAAAAAIEAPSDSSNELSDRLVMQWCVLDMNCVTSMDATALRRLDALISGELHRSRTFCWTHVSPVLLDLWTRTGFLEHIGADHVFASLPDAVEYCRPDHTKVDPSANES